MAAMCCAVVEKALRGRGGTAENSSISDLGTICRRQVEDEWETISNSSVADDQRLFLSQHVSFPTHLGHRLRRGRIVETSSDSYYQEVAFGTEMTLCKTFQNLTEGVRDTSLQRLA